MKYTLFTTYYLAEDAIRNEENLICLNKNIENKNIEKIFLILQNEITPSSINNEKIEFIHLGKRPTFSDFFKLINQFRSEHNKRCIIANSDIYFDDTVSLLNDVDLNKTVITLTRWDLLHSGEIKFYNKYLSQDVWIVDNYVSPNIGQYFIGQHGCDNRLLKELSDEGFKIKNPSLNIKTIHVHMSALRPYFNDPNYKFVEGEYLYSFPSGLYNPINLWILKFLDKEKYDAYKYNLKNYYYIRFEYYYKSFKNELQKIKLNKIQQISSFFPSLYYYSLFKISR